MLPQLLPVLAQALTLTAGDTSDARVRYDGTRQNLDLLTTGRVALDLRLRRVNWMLYYGPSVAELGVVSSPASAPYLQNTGGLQLVYRLSPRTSVTWAETGAYGQQSTRVLTPTTGTTSPTSTTNPDGSQGGGTIVPTGQTNAGVGVVPVAPGNATIRFGSLASTLGLNHILDRSWSSFVLLGYSTGGGLNSFSRSFIPQARTLTGTVLLSYNLSPRDQLAFISNTTYSVTQSTFVQSTRRSAPAYIQSLSTGWSHRMSQVTSFMLSGGGAYVDSTATNGVHVETVLPVASASLTSRDQWADWRVTAIAGVSYQPVVDRFFGGVAQSLSPQAGLTWTRQRVTLQLGAAASRLMFAEGGIALLWSVTASELLSYRLDRRAHWTVSVGALQGWQRFATMARPLVMNSEVVSLSYTTGALPL